MNHVASFLLIFSALALSACGGGSTGKVMADHPIYQYQPPPEVEDAEEEDLDDEEEDLEDEAEEEADEGDVE